MSLTFITVCVLSIIGDALQPAAPPPTPTERRLSRRLREEHERARH